MKRRSLKCRHLNTVRSRLRFLSLCCSKSLFLNIIISFLHCFHCYIVLLWLLHLHTVIKLISHQVRRLLSSINKLLLEVAPTVIVSYLAFIIIPRVQLTLIWKTPSLKASPAVFSSVRRFVIKSNTTCGTRLSFIHKIRLKCLWLLLLSHQSSPKAGKWEPFF